MLACALTNFLEVDHNFDYKLESELLGINYTQMRFMRKIAVPSLFSFNARESREKEARTERKKGKGICFLCFNVYCLQFLSLN